MFDRPMARFVACAFLGVIASFSISFGLIAAVVAVAVVVLVGVAWKSYAAISAGLMGIGLAWLVFAALSFSMTLSNGPGSGGGGRYVPFFLVAGAIFLAGVAVGVRGFLRNRTKRQGLPA
jgi:hypothetical protein